MVLQTYAVPDLDSDTGHEFTPGQYECRGSVFHDIVLTPDLTAAYFKGSASLWEIGMSLTFSSMKRALRLNPDFLKVPSGVRFVSSLATLSMLTSPMLLSISNVLSIKDGFHVNALMGLSVLWHQDFC